MAPIVEDRELRADERRLICWMLEHGSPGATAYLGQLEKARVYSRCGCGCASIDLSNDGRRPSNFRMKILSDYQWRNDLGHLFGAFVFDHDGLLAGLDLWSQDGKSVPDRVPHPEDLRPA